MKRYSMFLLVFVLTAALMTGCGCTGPGSGGNTDPTILPTNGETTTPVPSTTEITQPSSDTTASSTQPSETIDRGNGALLPETTDAAGESTAETGIGGNGSAGRSMSKG